VNTLLYHWSPVERRERIETEGLVPGSWSTDALWRPPYLCFSDSPSLAWALSPMMPRGQAYRHWDLWMVWSKKIARYETVLFEVGELDPGAIKEYRVFETIPHERLWFVGTRPLEPVLGVGG
jgi:hypothetical protein